MAEEEMEVDNGVVREYKYDVFIVYSSKDKKAVEKKIYPKLRDAGFSVFNDNNFIPGKTVIENITDAVYYSKKTLIYLTKQSLESTWCRLELLLALERSQNYNAHSVILLINGLSEQQMSTVSFLRIAPKVQMLDSDITWMEKLKYELSAEKSATDVLPAGNLAHGHAWSHFNGFLQYVLPEIEEKIMESKWYSDNPGRMPVMIYELLPQSSKCPQNIPDIDSNIKLVGYLEDIVHNSAGNYRRLRLPVHSITDNDGSVYYCVCEYPSVINSIYLMKANKLARITDGERRLQLCRLYYTLNAILHHTKLEKGLGRGRLLLFNDEEESPSTVLLKAIKQNLKMSNQESIVDPSPIVLYQRDQVPKVCEYDVYATCCDQDKVMCEDIKKHLQRKGFTCRTKMDFTDGKSVSQCIIDALKRCRWFILIYSKEVVHSGWLTFDCLLAIQQCVYDNNVRLIPVLKDVDQTEVPHSLSWITFIDAKNDKSYLENIVRSLKNVPIELETMIPAGNVSDGLAWGYVVNYLRFILFGVSKKIDEVFGGVTDYICPKKLYVLCPQSCITYQSLENADRRISKHTHVIVHHRDQTGMQRDYHCDIYKIKEYYFVGQYAAPIKCLHEMLLSKIAGLKEKEMLKEGKRFFEKTKTILSGPASGGFGDMCSLLYFDDSKISAGDVILEQILKDIYG